MQRSLIWLAFVSSIVLAMAVPRLAAASALEVRLSPSDIHWERLDSAFRVHVKGGVSASIPGSPDLPVVVKTVRPPVGQRLAKVEIISQSWERLDPPGSIATFLPAHFARINPESGSLLETLVTQTRGGYQRGERLDGFVVSPIQRRETGWYICTRLNLDLVFEPDEDFETALQPRAGSRWAVPDEVLGVEDFRAKLPGKVGETDSRLFRPREDGGLVDFVIITGEAFLSAVEPLKQWRMDSGYYTVVKSVESIYAEYPEGVDGAEKIRLFLRDAYSAWGISSALLLGDTAIIPPRFARSNFFTGDDIPTDMYYQCLDGNWNGNGNSLFGEGARTAFFFDDRTDLFPEIFVGRLPVNTVEEASTVIGKILTYETAPPVDESYPASVLLLAEVLFPQNWAGEPSILFDGADLAETTAVIVDNGDMDIKKLYENYLPFEGAEPETLPVVIDELNQGYGIVHHVGHGFHNNIAVGLGGNSLTIPIVDGLMNGNRASFLYAINCTSSAIDFDAIGEHFLRNPNGGTFSSVGSTRFDFPGTSAAYDKLFYELLFSDHVTKLGEAFAFSKTPFIPLSEMDNANRWTQFTLIFFGDPNTHLYTTTPTALSVSHAASASQGSEQTFTVSPPAEGVQVTVHVDGELFVTGFTNASGVVNLLLQSSALGTASVTAVASNRIPYRGSLEITAPAGAYPMVASLSVDDASGGNGNGLLELGESGEVEVRLRNDGAASISGLAINAMAEEPISVTGQVSGPTTLGVGEESSFTFTVDVGETGETRTTALALTLGSDQGGWSLAYGLNVGGPMLQLEGLLIEEISGDGDNVAEPFEEIAITPQISNRGPGTSRSLSGELLFVQSAGSSFTKATTTYGPIASGDIGPGSGFEPFTIEIGPGPELPVVELILRDGAQERFRRFIDFTPPAVPTEISLTGKTDAIEVRWKASDDEDVMRYFVWASDTEEGPFEQVAGFGFVPSAYYVEQSLPPLSPRFYQLASQDSSGNMSARSPIARGTTTLPLIAGFPVASGLGTTTSPVAIDADHDGRMDIFTGGEAVYAFHGDGSELRDGDMDARTLGVWALVNPVDAEDGVWAAPAAADLDGDGRIEIVAATRKRGEVHIWDQNGIPRPGWPKGTTAVVGGAATLVGGPVLTDLTGDGNLEIVLHSDRAVYAYRHDGTEVVDGDNDSQTEGVFFPTGSGASYASVAAADFDSDDKSEIVVCTRAGRLYLLDDDGSVMEGYPIQYGGDLVSSPAIADLDGNGSLEIIFSTGADSLEVINADGSRRQGWPQYTLMNQDFYSSPAIADWDNNGSLEIAIVAGNNRVHLFDKDGNPFDGFPVRFFDAFGSGVSVKSSGAVGNVDTDSDLEFVYGDQSGQIFALNLDGTLAEGFPIQMGSGIEGGFVVMDLDEDGINEIALTALDANTYLYQTTGVVGTNLGWPMFHHDPRRTGFYDTPIQEDIPPGLSIGVLQSTQVPEQATIYVVSTHVLTAAPDVTLDSAPIDVSEIGSDTRAYRSRVSLAPGSHTVSVSATSVAGVDGNASRTFDAAAAPTRQGWTSLGEAQVFVQELQGWPSVLLGQDAKNNPYAPPQSLGARQIGPSGWKVPTGTRVRLPMDPEWSAAIALAWTGSEWKALGGSAGSDDTIEFSPEHFGWFKVQEADQWSSVRPLSVQALYPNPFAQKTRINFTLSNSEEVQVDVFDVRGAKVRTLARRVFDAGQYELTWDRNNNVGRSVAEGIYFVRVKAKSGPASVQKVVVLSEGGAR